MIVRLTEEQICLLAEETKRNYPIEACGLLFGDISNEESVVRKIVSVRNVLQSSILFQIDPEEFIKVLFEAEKDDMQLIGFFHSHPAAPQPSVTDVRYMQLWPENIWLIISSIDYSLAAYQTVNGVLKRINIEVSRER